MNPISISQMKQIAILVIMVSLAMALISGCAPSTTRVDPLASLNLGATTRQSEYKELSLAIILSDNTRNTVEQLQKWNGMMVFNQAAQVDIDTVFKGITDIFRANFLNVTTAQSIDDAQKLNVDLIAMLDINMELSNFRWNPTIVEISSILLSPGKTEIDTVRGKGTRKGIEGGRGVVALSISDAQVNFENALIASNKLHAFRNAKLQALAKTAVKSSAPLHKDSPGFATSSSGIDQPSFPAESRMYNEDDVAVVIGIEKYQNAPPSDYSYDDAVLVKAYLVALGMKERNIELLTNEKATQSGIRKSLETWLPNRVKKVSRVFVYFSGHGAPEPASGDGYIVPSDGDPNYLSDTGYPLKRLYEKMGRLQVAEVVVAVDSCFSGAGGRSILAKGARPLVMMAQTTAVSPNMAVITATQGTQISASSPEQGHGIFTYYFLKAIKEGKKNLADVYGYIKPMVEDAAKILNVVQSPSITPDPDKLQGRFILRK
jgi:hypothetical protein